jgi:hypothetical protein
MYKVETIQVCDESTLFTPMVKYVITHESMESKPAAEIILNFTQLQDIEAIHNGEGKMLIDEINKCLAKLK